MATALSETEKRALLTEPAFEPRPLVSLQHNIGIIWSAKSACTKIVAWFFTIHGLLPAATFYHHWPHNFRLEVLYQSKTYQRWIEQIELERVDWFHFVRDPVKRALSGYRHNVRYGYADKKISAAIGRDVSADEGLSLNEFLEYLSKIDLDRGDIHVKLQKHPFSGLAKVINVDTEDMQRVLNKIEICLGLHPTDFASHPVFQSIDQRHNAKPTVSESINSDRRYSRRDSCEEWPVTVANVDPDTVRKIESLYASDIEFIYRRLNTSVDAPR